MNDILLKIDREVYIRKTLAYKLACYYMGKAELYDRTLTDVKSPYDPTEAFLADSTHRRLSAIYLNKINNVIKKIIIYSNDFYLDFDDVREEIQNHSNYSAQDWVMEYETFLKDGEYDFIEKVVNEEYDFIESEIKGGV